MKTMDELLKTHKQCSYCKVFKEHSEFNIHNTPEFHLDTYCKQCKKTKSAEQAQNRFNKNPKRFLEIRDKHNKNRTKEQKEKYNKQRKENHSEKIHARYKVSYAISKGELIRLPCVICGEIKSEAHHDDYSKPLDVTWLCRKHHNEHHGKNNNK